MSNNGTNEQIDLTGQVAIVTGGGRGIGRAMALALAKAGAAVAVVARTEEQLAETVALIEHADDPSRQPRVEHRRIVAGVCVQEHEVHVGGEVQLMRAELAHAKHDQPLRLAVAAPWHTGFCDRPVVQSVERLTDTDVGQLRELLDRPEIHDFSLDFHAPTGEGSGREMHEVLRQYAKEKLARQPEIDEATLRDVSRLKRSLAPSDLGLLDQAALHAFIDDLQITKCIGTVNNKDRPCQKTELFNEQACHDGLACAWIVSE